VRKPITDEEIIRGLRADIDHSALLRRLLEGEQALPVPPPKQYSYPAYNLVEKDEPQFVLGVWFSKDDDMVVIEQSPWRIVEKRGDEDYIVQWDFNHKFRLYMKDDVKVGEKYVQDGWEPILKRAWVMENYGEETKA